MKETITIRPTDSTPVSKIINLTLILEAPETAMWLGLEFSDPSNGQWQFACHLLSATLLFSLYHTNE